MDLRFSPFEEKRRRFLDSLKALNMARIWLIENHDGEVVWSEDFPGSGSLAR
jgi:hypothetical protein